MTCKDFVLKYSKDRDWRTGEILVVQKESDDVMYYKVSSNFPAVNSQIIPATAQLPGIFSLASYIGTLWGNEDNADITITYGPEGRQHAHRLILARAPYFNTLFNNNAFAKVGATTSLPDDLSPPAMELVLRYLYFGDMHPLSSQDATSMLAVIRVLDFLLMREEVSWLCGVLSLQEGRAETLVEALHMVPTCTSGSKLVEWVAWRVVKNIEMLREGPLSEHLAAEPSTLAILKEEMEKLDAGINSRLSL
ncbi:hypothetical protein HDV00_000579 [Rhizophlyctis rosea]|nr:hypothetical protein HDV00_000579 [Rhizophlyctis rosea]